MPELKKVLTLAGAVGVVSFLVGIVIFIILVESRSGFSEVSAYLNDLAFFLAFHEPVVFVIGSLIATSKFSKWKKSFWQIQDPQYEPKLSHTQLLKSFLYAFYLCGFIGPWIFIGHLIFSASAFSSSFFILFIQSNCFFYILFLKQIRMTADIISKLPVAVYSTEFLNKILKKLDGFTPVFFAFSSRGDSNQNNASNDWNGGGGGSSGGGATGEF